MVDTYFSSEILGLPSPHFIFSGVQKRFSIQSRPPFTPEHIGQKMIQLAEAKVKEGIQTAVAHQRVDQRRLTEAEKRKKPDNSSSAESFASPSFGHSHSASHRRTPSLSVVPDSRSLLAKRQKLQPKTKYAGYDEDAVLEDAED